MRMLNAHVELTRLHVSDIEQVREWRNAPHISKHMLSKTYITEEMQKNWFDSLDDDTNFYFVIHVQGKKVGVVSIKDINFQLQTAEPGIFIAETQHSLPQTPFGAALLLNDFAFNTLKLKKLVMRMLDNNKKAMRFNRTLGYVAKKTVSAEQYTLYELTADRYNQKKQQIEKLLAS